MLVDEASRREGTAAVAVAVAAVDTVEKSRPSESRDRRSRLRFFRVPRARPIVVHRHDASTNILPPIRMRVPGRRDVRLASRYCRMLVGDRLRVCLAEVSGLRVVLRTSAFSRPTSFRMSAGLKLHECRSGWRYQEIGTVDKIKWVACMHVMGPCHTADWHVDQPFHHLQAPGKTIESILLSLFVERVMNSYLQSDGLLHLASPFRTSHGSDRLLARTIGQIYSHCMNKFFFQRSPSRDTPQIDGRHGKCYFPALVELRPCQVQTPDQLT